ncbi:MAG: tetratricopeptide repeat protein [Thermoanaerobaculia bacterium]
MTRMPRPRKRQPLDVILIALRDPETWKGYENRARRPLAAQAFRRRVDAILERQAHAQERAREIVSETSVSTSWFEIAARRENRDPVIVRELLNIAHALRTSAPADACRLQQDAIYLGSQLDPSPETSEIMGFAHKELATTYMLLYDARKALEALDRAEMFYADAVCNELPLAVVALVRAVVYQRIDRHDDALATAEEASRVFARYSDGALLLKACTVRANVYIDVGRLDEALVLWRAIIADARAADDLITTAQALSNLGLCFYKLKQPAEAATVLGEAITIYEELGDEVNLPRIRRTLAHIDRESGRWESALSTLLRARAEWDAKGCSLSGGEVALDIAEMLIEAGDIAGAIGLLEPLPRQFAEAGHAQNAIAAAAFLRQAVGERRATTKTVQHVKRFVAASRTQPRLAFVEPQD